MIDGRGSDTPDMSHIAGNASPEIKAVIATPMWFEQVQNSFGVTIFKRINVTEVSIVPKTDEPLKKEARVICELEVSEDMLNGGGKIHGGCSATLVDLCTSYALLAYTMGVLGDPAISVSQAINMVYHSPAELGDKLRIISTTMSVGSIWHPNHDATLVT
ncbi:hypothetical protein ONZ45_g13218 [Pleurotus djamor]|nr:hypothetical protein ONZ45_g13218 [Pleurotus djamor]